ncbi:MAG: acyltransferase family protein [Bacilli bacterium]|nr:acyltransferase family protein [Bacilli bacterium]
MDSSKKNYKNLNLIRVIACIMVFLYHLGLLKGGYLAVCIFFVLSGYLSIISASRKDSFSLKSYYKNRFIKIYIPLLVVTLLTIFVSCHFTDNLWLNLKPEATSVLLGYNNFWQLSANLDYFSMHSASPFIHLWYIAILMQFELIFPIIFLILRKLDFKKKTPTIILGILSFISVIYFYKVSTEGIIMVTYYHSLARIFSIVFGLTLGSIYLKEKPKTFKLFIFYLYLFIIGILCFTVKADCKYMPLFMILVSLISCRLIGYAISFNNDENKFDKVIKFFSNISYEIYLVQYPIIFFMSNINIPFKNILIIILTIIISYIIHLGLNVKKDKLSKIIAILILIPTLWGGYYFIITKDHTEEMNELEKQLNQNQETFKSKQAEFAQKYKEEEEKWQQTLNDLENGEEAIKDVVANLKIIGVGDSVMLGALTNLYARFPNGYFDAAVSRTAWVANNILIGLKSQNILGDPVIFNLGANGDCSEDEKIRIIETCAGRDIFWINTTNDYAVNVNSKLNNLANRYNNFFVIDWASASNGHPEYFIADGIHLTPSGRDAYVRTIYDTIYNVYLNRYKIKKEEIIKEHENEENKIIEFYGNNVLLNIFDDIHKNILDSKFNIKEYNYDLLINDLKNNDLSEKIVFVFDNSLKLTKKEYENIIKICKDNEIYIINFNENIKNIKNSHFIDFSNNLDSYLLADRIHLSSKGNEELINIIIKNLT